MSSRVVVYEGGVLVDGGGVRKADLVVAGGRIVGEFPPGSAVSSQNPDEVVDVGGRFVIPGLVDAHVHFNLRVGGGRSSTGVMQGTSECLRGGVTTVADFADVPQVGETLESMLEARERDYAGQSQCDYVFHSTVPQAGDWCVEVRSLAERGVLTFKVFTTYGARGLMSRDSDLLAVMEVVAGTGSTVWVHCEDDALVEWSTSRLRAEGKTGAAHLPGMRPPASEVAAIQRVVHYARVTGARVHVVHVSTEEGARVVGEAKAAGVRITAETCPHYLMWNREKNEGTEGPLWTMAPPLRTAADVEGLWRLLADSALDMVTTDSCGFPREWKEGAREDVSTAPMGIDGAGMVLPTLFSAGFLKKRLSMGRLVEVASTAPARLLGLYPRKGSLCPGADADLVMVGVEGPKAEDECRWIPELYAEEGLTGWPWRVVLGGRTVVMNGSLVGGECGGKRAIQGGGCLRE